jgi:hypothetical protein
MHGNSTRSLAMRAFFAFFAALALAAAPAAAAQRYTTDPTLRTEMQGIRASVEGLGHYEHGHIGPPQAVQLAEAIEGHVRTIVATCKLPPDADAALHTIIVPLVQHAGALKKDPADLAHVEGLRNALAAYDRQFRDR